MIYDHKWWSEQRPILKSESFGVFESYRVVTTERWSSRRTAFALCSGPQTFWMLGQIRGLINVREPDYFVYRKQKKYNTHNTSHVCIFLFIFFARYMFAMWFMKLLLLLHNSCRLIFGSVLDATIRRVSCKYASEIFFTTAI